MKYQDMKKITTWIIPIFFLALILGSVQPIPASANSDLDDIEFAESLYSYLEVVESSQEGITLEFSPPEPVITEDLIVGSHCQNVNIPGLFQDSLSGRPALPAQGVMIGIPIESSPNLEIIGSDSITLDGNYSLCPNSQPAFQRDENNLPQYAGVTYENIDIINGFLPETPAELASDGFLRHQKFLSLQFNPIQYNSQTGELRYFNSIKIRVDFNQSNSSIQQSGMAIEDPLFEGTYQKLLVNYEQALPWRGDSSSEESTTSLRAAGDMYKITVEQEGLYEITYTDLVNAGIPASTLDPQTLQIFHQDQEVAILVNGEGDGSFDSTDTLLFFGQEIHSKYTDENVYWLRFGVEGGLRMADRDGTPSGSVAVPFEFKTTLHMEEDLEYWWEYPSGSDSDTWYWQGIFYGVSTVLNFSLSNPSSIEHTLDLLGLIRRYVGSAYPHVRVYINSNPTPIYDGIVSAGVDNNIVTTLMQSDLVDGSNTLSIDILGTSDYFLVNRFDLDYWDTYFAENDQLFFDGDYAGTWEYQVDGFTSDAIQAFNLTDPLAPVLIENAVVSSTGSGFQISFEETISAEQHYLGVTPDAYISPTSITLDASSSWKSLSNGADYIIISHSDFMDEMAPLVAHRSGEGYRVVLVDVQDVYDEFNGGIFSPEAIQTFLAYAFEYWSGDAPSYVLLVGDGHWNYKNIDEPIFGTGGVNFIPPYLQDIDPWLRETATDNFFVSVAGEDNLPDMYIGRFPASTDAEAAAMVTKTLDYEGTTPSWDWNTRLTFVADDPDDGGDYPVESDHIISLIPSMYSSDKIYYMTDTNYTNPGDARAALIEDINEGRLIVHYAGHAGYQRWADEHIFRLTDLPLLTNAEAYPFMVPMTCQDGYFINPKFDALSESIVRMDGAGAIASFSPTGYGLTSGHRVLDESLIDNLFKTENNELGYLTTQAKYDLFALLPSQGYLVDTYMLFGDPALDLQTVPSDLEAPTNLAATASTSSQIDLTWVDNSSTETAFLIERSPNGVNDWVQIAVTTADVTAYSDTSCGLDTTYYYRVRAYRSGDDQYSYFSNEAHATTLVDDRYGVYLPMFLGGGD